MYNGISDWMKFKYVKASSPVELAEYAIDKKVSEEATFKWWVGQMFWTMKAITKYWRIHKYDIWLPESITEALKLVNSMAI